MPHTGRLSRANQRPYESVKFGNTSTGPGVARSLIFADTDLFQPGRLNPHNPC